LRPTGAAARNPRPTSGPRSRPHAMVSR
jgi:hypothetical protein